MQTKCPHQLRAVPRIGYYYQDEIPLMRTRLRTVNVILNGESMCTEVHREPHHEKEGNKRWGRRK